MARGEAPRGGELDHRYPTGGKAVRGVTAFYSTNYRLMICQEIDTSCHFRTPVLVWFKNEQGGIPFKFVFSSRAHFLTRPEIKLHIAHFPY